MLGQALGLNDGLSLSNRSTTSGGHSSTLENVSFPK